MCDFSLNCHITGYYRVNYDTENWRLLSTAINASHLVDDMDVMNRAQLMFDSFALAKAKELDYATAFDTTNYLMFETQLTPWSAALGHLSYIRDRFADDTTAKSLFQVREKKRAANVLKLLAKKSALCGASA